MIIVPNNLSTQYHAAQHIWALSDRRVRRHPQISELRVPEPGPRLPPGKLTLKGLCSEDLVGNGTV